MKKLISCVLFLAGCFISGLSFGEASCSATNENNDICQISCPTGQSAECHDGTGASSPSCQCKGEPDYGTTQKLPLVKSLSKPINTSVNNLFIKTNNNPIEEKLTTTDVLNTVNGKLSTLRDYQITDSCTEVVVGRVCEDGGSCVMSIPGTLGGPPSTGRCPKICRELRETKCNKAVGKLTASLPFAIEAEPNVILAIPNYNDIPTDILGYRETYTNCSSLQQSITFRHSETTRVGNRISKTNALTIGRTLSAKVSFKMPVGKGEIGGETGASFNRSVTVTDLDEENLEETRVLEMSVPFLIAPYTKSTLDHQWVKRIAPVKYKGTVTFDGPINPNKENINRLSQVLITSAERTFEFSGTVTSTLLQEGVTLLNSRELSKSECAGNSGLKIDSVPYN